MSTIYWSGKSTNGVLKWKYEADSFKELFDLLMEKEIINDPDYEYTIGRFSINTGKQKMTQNLKMKMDILIMIRFLILWKEIH